MNPEDLIPPLAQWLGIDPASALFYLGVVIAIARLLSRKIPDDAVGFWGIVRDIASFISIDISNKLTPGITVNDVTKRVIGLDTYEEVKDKIVEKAQEGLITEVTDELLPPSKNPFKRGPDGRFLGIRKKADEPAKPDSEDSEQLSSPVWVGVLALVVTLVMLSGCATMTPSAVARYACEHREQVRDLVERVCPMTYPESK